MMVWIRGGSALVGTVLAVACSAYILVNADRLERTAPFFQGADLAIGGGLAVGILLLTWIHWGLTLTSIVALSIAYFFYGQHIPHPMFAHVGYDPAFVMSYLGLGVTQGFFLYARGRRHLLPGRVCGDAVRSRDDADDRRSRAPGRRPGASGAAAPAVMAAGLSVR
jgi:hypothetical protein